MTHWKWYGVRNEMILMGVNGNLPSHLITERDLVYKIQHVKTLETMSTISHTNCNVPPSKTLILVLKKDWLLANQIIWGVSAVVQCIIQLAQVTCTVYTVPRGDISQSTPLYRHLRLWTGRTAHRKSRGIALLFHDHSTRRG
jgi:hypothetical protein